MATGGKSKLVVVSFDFGTTYSGYAYSFNTKPDKINTNKAWAESSGNLLSFKTATCVLLNPEEGFEEFGFAAEDKYSSLVEDEDVNHKEWFLFRRFKMSLYQNKNISSRTMIEDISGKMRPALTVFTHAIQFLYDHFWKSLRKETIGIKDDDVQYVLTVPAIWNDKAKQFMRKACNKAGIPSDQLRMALEPEAASVWCQTLSDQMPDDLRAPGAKYMVVDLGGGTADITVNEMASDGTLRELHKGSGGPWGGTMVDNNYLAFLSTLFGEVMDTFRKNETGDYLSMLRNFEHKKRSIRPNSDGNITFWIPISLRDMFEIKGTRLKDKLESSIFKGVKSPNGDKLRVDMSIVRKWFDAPLKSVTDHVKDLFSKPELQEVQYILLVGGFAEYDLAHETFSKIFSGKNIITPAEAGLTVLRGAVRCGHRPDLISARRSRFTYGVAILADFDAKKHDLDKLFISHGKKRCRDVFHTIVAIGDVLQYGKEFPSFGGAVHVDQKECNISIYSTETPDPKYITDPGCTYLGKVTVDYSHFHDIDDMRHKQSLIFWDTEIKVKVEILKTGKIYESTIDLA